MCIKNLANHPEFIPAVARWRWDEWGHLDPDRTLNDVVKVLETHIVPEKIPQTLIAILGDQPVGTASLTQHDMKTRMDLSPWLAGVFVPPEYRSRGIASSLVRAIENLAGDLGYEEIFLYTNSAEGLYKKLCWVKIGREEYKGREVVIMSKMITT